MIEGATGFVPSDLAPSDWAPNDWAPNDWAPRKLTLPQARMEQLLYWSRKSIPERLAAMTALTRRMYKMRGIDLDELKADFTLSRVRRRQG